MPEKTKSELLEDLEVLQRERLQMQQLIAEYRKELRQAKKLSTSLARGGQRAEQLTQSYANTFELLYRFSSDLIFRLNKDGKVLFVSPACTAILGYSAEELAGRPFLELLESKSRRQADLVIDTLSQQSQVVEQQWTWKSRHGSLPLKVYCRAVSHPQTGETEYIGIARPAKESSSADQLGASAPWLASIAHELKQPLTAIANYAGACSRLIRSGQDDKDELLQALDQVVEQAVRAGEILRRMRSFAVPGALELADIDINQLVRETLKLLEEDILRNGVRIELHLDANLPTVKADRVRIGQVLVNLVRNAIESFDRTPATERLIVITTRATPVELEVAIRDTGDGLSPEVAQRLFEPFRTTKPHGMGLGLALSRAIIMAHGGRLWAEPHADRGCSFHFTIPARP